MCRQNRTANLILTLRKIIDLIQGGIGSNFSVPYPGFGLKGVETLLSKKVRFVNFVFNYNCVIGRISFGFAIE